VACKHCHCIPSLEKPLPRTSHFTTHIISSFHPFLFHHFQNYSANKKIVRVGRWTHTVFWLPPPHKHRVGLRHSLPLLPSQEAAFHRLHLLRSSSLTPPSNPSSVNFNLSAPFPSFRPLGFPGVQSHRSWDPGRSWSGCSRYHQTLQVRVSFSQPISHALYLLSFLPFSSWCHLAYLVGCMQLKSSQFNLKNFWI